jgi:hypothetical protein
MAVQSSVQVLHWVLVPRCVAHVVSPVHMPQGNTQTGAPHWPDAAETHWLVACGSVVVQAWPHDPQSVAVEREVLQVVSPVQIAQPASHAVPHTFCAPPSVATPASEPGALQVAAT